MIRKGKVCWNCQHSIFYKRTGSNYGRGRGWCVRLLEIDRTWRPPDAFRKDLFTLEEFPATFSEFVSKLAAEYYGKRYAIDLELGEELHGNWSAIKEHYAKMKTLFDNRKNIIAVSWQDVCDFHEG